MVDEIDLSLMQELRKDGRRNYTELGKILNLVEGTVRHRVKKLLNNDLMKVIAVPNVRKLGYQIVGLIGLQITMADLRGIAVALAKKPNICYLAFVAGRYDLIAVVITKTTEELSRFIEAEISTVPGVLRTETWINLEIIKGDWAELDISGLIEAPKNRTPKNRTPRTKRY